MYYEIIKATAKEIRKAELKPSDLESISAAIARAQARIQAKSPDFKALESPDDVLRLICRNTMLKERSVSSIFFHI